MSTANAVTLRPARRFDFNSFRDFRNSYERALDIAGTRLLIVDLQDVQYIDSAALGILLLMRERATAANCTVELHNLHGVTKEVLEIANFQKIFTFR
ncbi:STAS domain-containing protein [Pseudomonas sp. N040]|uniref:STAS domain-containing protein n=1 Tax=Pseudomonas sp. N040 TaxID=2785325 RepID=UPI0018A31CAC|nr:STAS domain-containing protein [Pseudomonas sp. N040]MBF7728554.1 STAS domain-containing protein [Pseudomonas sp. N040]MBW7012194.1 STAS domain-containing protein [Pseudomonas sp. N040]